MNWLLWAIPLVAIVFLWSINEFLRGRLKEVLSGVMAIVMFSLIAIAFVVSGWKVGVGVLVGTVVLMNLFRPVALAVARRLVDYLDLGFQDYARRKAERTIRDFGSESYFKSREREEKVEARQRSHTVSTAMKTPQVAEVLSRANATERDLVAFYDRIEVRSIPPSARQTVLQNARLVAFFLDNSEPSEGYDGTYCRNVNVETMLRLELWINSNPGGDEPHRSRS